MDLTKLRLPESVKVSGSLYRIHTGHPHWFRFAQLIENDQARYGDFDFLYIDEKPNDRKEGFQALFDFYYEKTLLPRADGSESGLRVIDYTIDADFIYGAILQCFHVDLFEKEIHWHKVRAMIHAVKDTKLNDIQYYRSAKDSKDTVLTKMKNAWALPEENSGDADADLREFNALFD